MAAIPRCSAGGARHPPDRVYAHQRRGVRRAASSPTERGIGESRTYAAAAVNDDGPAGGRAGRGDQRGAATYGLRRGGGPVYGPARIAALAHERAEPIARRSRARLGRSRGCLMQCFADELDLFTGFA